MEALGRGKEGGGTPLLGTGGVKHLAVIPTKMKSWGRERYRKHRGEIDGLEKEDTDPRGGPKYLEMIYMGVQGLYQNC